MHNETRNLQESTPITISRFRLSENALDNSLVYSYEGINYN